MIKSANLADSPQISNAPEMLGPVAIGRDSTIMSGLTGHLLPSLRKPCCAVNC